MGTYFCKIRSSKQPGEIKMEREESMIETEIYLPGSLDYLEQVGMDRTGQFLSDDLSVRNQRPINLQKVFDDYCDEYLDVNNSDQYINYNGSIKFVYFLRIYKIAFFWKKIRFEKERIKCLKKRRGFLFAKDMERYKEACDEMTEVEE